MNGPTREEKIAAAREAARSAVARADSLPRGPTPENIAEELRKCGDGVDGCIYFINTYVKILDAVAREWIPFTLWPAQEQVLRDIVDTKFSCAMKARQLGFTWLLGVAYPLWQMIFKPIAHVIAFSQRDEEAKALLERIKGSYSHLPDWMKQKVVTNSAHEFSIGNGSIAEAQPSSAGGRSASANYVVADEADYIEDLASLVQAAKPTVDAGSNQMVLISTVNDKKPNSYFQKLFANSQGNATQWKTVFIPWFEHPARTREWYEQEMKDSFLLNGTLDKFYKEYPETVEQALAPRELDKRFPPGWVMRCTLKKLPLTPPPDAPPHKGIKFFKLPERGRTYGVGADPSGGMTDGDPAVAQVIDAVTLEQCALLAGKIEPDTFGDQVADLATYYNNAPILFELNNHGNAMRTRLKDRAVTLRNGVTKDGVSRKPGWLTTEWSKSYLYDTAVKVIQNIIVEAETFEQDIVPILYDDTTSFELASIDIDTLKAPEGWHDDHALAWALAQMCVYRGSSSMFIEQHNLYNKSAAPSIPPPPKLDPAVVAQAIARAQRGETEEVQSEDAQVGELTLEQKLAIRGIKLRRPLDRR